MFSIKQNNKKIVLTFVSLQFFEAILQLDHIIFLGKRVISLCDILWSNCLIKQVRLAGGKNSNNSCPQLSLMMGVVSNKFVTESEK